MSLLSLIQEAQDSIGLARSSVVISSTSNEVLTLLALAQQEGRELSRRHPWQALLTEKTFTSTATEEQSGVIPSDLDRFVNETFYNRTQKRALTGPLSVQEWQTQKALTATILTDSFRIRGDAFLMTPTPAAGDTYAYEYVTKNWCESSVGTGQTAWAADSDTGKLDETLMVLGLIWRFKRAKGFDYGEDFATYQQQITQAIMRDGARRTISFATDEHLFDNARIPIVPEGSWNL